MKKLCPLLAIFIFMFGCTNQVWSPAYKEESIVGFYVVPERNELLVSGKDSGYIFPIGEEFEEILILSMKISFEPILKDFILEKNNTVSGVVTLMASEKNISQEEESRLYQLGFKKSTFIRDVIECSVKIKGYRYSLEGDMPLKKFAKPYSLRVAQPDSGFDVARKIVSTPGAVVIDAAVVLPSALLLVPIMATDSL